jgi:hypothetical protein
MLLRNNVEARLKQYLIRTFCTLLLAGLFFASPVFAAARGVVLNFNEVDISTMVKFISDLTGRNFVLDDRVKGKISVYSPSKLSIEEAYNVFVSVLVERFHSGSKRQGGQDCSDFFGKAIRTYPAEIGRDAADQRKLCGPGQQT